MSGIVYSVERCDGLVRWQCLLCASGAGSAPEMRDALRGADTHYAAAHAGDPLDEELAQLRARYAAEEPGRMPWWEMVTLALWWLLLVVCLGVMIAWWLG